MPSLLPPLKRLFSRYLKSASDVMRSTAIETIECEAEELENIFGILVLGSWIGLPSPPMPISLDLMPFMERELVLMMEKVDTADQPVSQLFSALKIG